MARPIKLRFQRKTRVPTKNAIVHQFRSDWRFVGMIDYPLSIKVFKIIDGTGVIETDAQFAKLILVSFGPGEYIVKAWKRGHEGFWLFMHIICFTNGFFKRIERNISVDEKEARVSVLDYKRLKSQLGSAESPNEKESIRQEIDSTEEMMSLNKEIAELTKGKKRGPYPYLKSIQPVYKEHEYQEYQREYKEEEIAQQTWW